jgi:DNA-binding response OmpR family regulator
MLPKTKILLVEDELSLALIVKDSLEIKNFEVVHCTDGESALKQFSIYKPDIVVLDVMLPKTDGFEVAKMIRNTNTTIPIIFLTAKSQTKDVLQGFTSGGNDYLKKPFSIEELIVRIKVLLSTNRLLLEAASEDFIGAIGKYTFDSRLQVLSIDNTTITLTAKEAALLSLLCKNKSTLVSKKSILLNIWGDDHFFNSRSMDVFITRLRKHLSKDADVQIINVRGLGYKLV